MVTQLASAGFLAIGAFLLFGGILNFWRGRDSVNWPMLEAEVLGSGVKVNKSILTGRSYKPLVRYRYAQQGATYEGSRIMFSIAELQTRSHEDAEQFIAPFRPGTKITVRVSPTNPRISVIEPGVDRRGWLALVISPLFLFIGIGGLISKFR